MPDLVRFTCPVELTAAGEGRTPRVAITAYTGGIMRVPGWGPVAIDLTGLDASGQLPILVDHDQTLAGIAGHGQAAVINGRLVVSGELPPINEAARQVVERAKAGFAWQASVGVQPARHEQVGAGATVTVNGKAIKADGMGFTLIRAGRLREVSIVALGADAETSVAVAASSKGTTTMAKEPAETTANDTIPNELRAAWDQPGLTNSERVMARWNATKFTDATVRAQTEKCLHAALAGNIDFRDFENQLLKAELRDAQLIAIRAERPTGPAIHASNRDTGGDVLEASLLLHLGHEKAAVKACGEQATEQARAMRLSSLHDVLRAALASHTGNVPAGRTEMIRAAFSTNQITTLLSNVAGKISTEAYQSVPSVARQVAKKLSVSDFKEHTGIRLTGDATFDEVGNAGEIKHGSLAESTFTFKVSTFARMFGLARQDIINDDLGKFEEVPRLLGRGAAVKVESAFFTLLLANTGDFFGSGNGNLATSSALSETGLNSAVTIFRQLVDTDGEPIMVEPRFLLAPAELEATARKLFISTSVVAAGGVDPVEVIQSANPYANRFTPLVAPHLSNDNYTGYSASSWYLFADPAAGPAAFGIAYLNGAEAPTIESQQADFNTLGLQWRGYLDFGVCQVDPVGAVMATE